MIFSLPMLYIIIIFIELIKFYINRNIKFKIVRRELLKFIFFFFFKFVFCSIVRDERNNIYCKKVSFLLIKSDNCRGTLSIFFFSSSFANEK